MIEAKFNRLDLRVVYQRIGILQQVSQVLIYLWGMFLLLSSVRMMPNYFQCKRDNICFCNFNINKETYRCYRG